MNGGRNLANLRRGEALAIQWVAFALQKISADENQGSSMKEILGEAKTVGGQEGADIALLGFKWTLNIVLAFATELALKALSAKETGHHEHDHNLLRLFDELSTETQHKLEIEYQKQQRTSSSTAGETLRQLLECHKDDFVKWRYLDDCPEDLITDANNLQFAICAMLEIYEHSDEPTH